CDLVAWRHSGLNWHVAQTHCSPRAHSLETAPELATSTTETTWSKCYLGARPLPPRCCSEYPTERGGFPTSRANSVPPAYRRQWELQVTGGAGKHRARSESTQCARSQFRNER